jgi:dipeptidyl aminopeptidase/acylaminoacyl peptidase
MRITIHALVFLVVCTSSLWATKPTWDIDDVIFTESIRDIQVSPDGRWAVWVHEAPNKERSETIGNLVRLELATGRETILTRGNESCSHPRWSPDGQRLAFLRPRSESREHATDDSAGNQIWLLDPTGGEPWPLT